MDHYVEGYKGKEGEKLKQYLARIVDVGEIGEGYKFDIRFGRVDTSVYFSMETVKRIEQDFNLDSIEDLVGLDVDGIVKGFITVGISKR